MSVPKSLEFFGKDIAHHPLNPKDVRIRYEHDNSSIDYSVKLPNNQWLSMFTLETGVGLYRLSLRISPNQCASIIFSEDVDEMERHLSPIIALQQINPNLTGIIVLVDKMEEIIDDPIDINFLLIDFTRYLVNSMMLARINGKTELAELLEKTLILLKERYPEWKEEKVLPGNINPRDLTLIPRND